jgi:hypothetical protein
MQNRSLDAVRAAGVCVADDLTYNLTGKCVRNGLEVSFRYANADKCPSKPQEIKCLGIGTIRSGANNDCRSPEAACNILHRFGKRLVIKFRNIKEYLGTTILHELLLATMIDTNDTVGHSTRPNLSGKMSLCADVSQGEAEK